MIDRLPLSSGPLNNADPRALTRPNVGPNKLAPDLDNKVVVGIETAPSYIDPLLFNGKAFNIGDRPEIEAKDTPMVNVYTPPRSSPVTVSRTHDSLLPPGAWYDLPINAAGVLFGVKKSRGPRDLGPIKGHISNKF